LVGKKNRKNIMKNISQQIRVNRFGLLMIIASTLLTSCQRQLLLAANR
jgi:hypothetical protein